MIHSIVYLSTYKILSNEEELKKIIEESRKNNASSNITGALLYCNGSIIQVLEGEKEVVSSLFEKIRRDQRHTQIIPLFQGSVQNRLFEKWAMGYSTLNTRNMQELREQFLFIDNPDIPVASDNRILSLLHTFFKNNYRN
ncbi:BLUF domain-containing protein [Dyadobacter sp. LJ53]|uniref:BLUF domain-containing protein n=1 Tax=Dyadobacter chenwenxiniae TaxID=2906456 RepID=UPI001F1F5AE8|nr:BLUF domain-containing protein [Dyadobacter chenwenxiniae]MCF0048584.1 BLUF domain-containing protein [Dyadobacter chenwenxiniae]